MNRCEQSLIAIEYNDSHRQFLVESNKKTKRTKRILERRLCKNLRIVYRLVFEVSRVNERFSFTIALPSLVAEVELLSRTVTNVFSGTPFPSPPRG